MQQQSAIEGRRRAVRPRAAAAFRVCNRTSPIVTTPSESGSNAHPTADAALSGASLSARVASGAGWMIAARFLMRIMGFVNTIVVARLLAPDDFGLVAIGVTAMQLLQGFSELGVGQAMVRFRDADDRDVNTLFTISVLRGVLLAAILAALAPLAGAFYDDPRVVGVFLGVAVFPLCLGFLNPRFYEFERELDFSKEFYALVVNKMAGVIVSIIVAVIFRTYWAIILGLVTNGVVQLVLSYVMRPYRPRFTVASWRKLVDFVGWMTGFAFVTALNNKLATLVLGRVLGPAGAGNYFVGHQLAELPVTELAYPISRAIYPGLSSLQGSPERMRLAYLQGVEALGAIAVPAGIGFALIATDVIYLLLGGKWLDAAPVVALLAPVIGLQMIFMATFYYALALGLTRLLFIRELIFFLLRTPVFVWAAIAHGLHGAVVAIAAFGFVHMALNMALYGRMTQRSPFEPVWAVRRSLVAVIAMSTVYLLGDNIFPHPAGAAGLALLSTKIFAAAATYIGVHLAAWRVSGRPDGVEALALRLIGQLRQTSARRGAS